MIELGAKVYLRACHAGLPGMVIRRDHGKFTVFWPDMNYWSRHRPESLELAMPADGEARFPPPAPIDPKKP
jgi:hypothetical protein